MPKKKQMLKIPKPITYFILVLDTIPNICRDFKFSQNDKIMTGSHTPHYTTAPRALTKEDK